MATTLKTLKIKLTSLTEVNDATIKAIDILCGAENYKYQHKGIAIMMVRDGETMEWAITENVYKKFLACEGCKYYKFNIQKNKDAKLEAAIEHQNRTENNMRFTHAARWA